MVFIAFALALFMMVTIIGFVIDGMVLSKEHDPFVSAFVYGPLSVIAFIFLIFYSFYYSPFPEIGMELLTFSTIGGLIFLYLKRKHKEIPASFAVINSAIGTAGYIFLLYFYYTTYLK